MKRHAAMILLVAIGAAVGCARFPAEDVAVAQRAVDAAHAAGAARHAPVSWTAVEDSQARLQAELRLQEGSLALARSYDRARILAIETAALADKAAAEARVLVAEKEGGRPSVR